MREFSASQRCAKPSSFPRRIASHRIAPKGPWSGNSDQGRHSSQRVALLRVAPPSISPQRTEATHWVTPVGGPTNASHRTAAPCIASPSTAAHSTASSPWSTSVNQGRYTTLRIDPQRCARLGPAYRRRATHRIDLSCQAGQ